MLRVGHKYDFEHHKNEALSCLTQQFPPELDEFSYDIEDGLGEEERFCYLDEHSSYSDVIQLAVDLRLEKILPQIYLVALLLPTYPVRRTYPNINNYLLKYSTELHLLWHRKCIGYNLHSVPTNSSTYHRITRRYHRIHVRIRVLLAPQRRSAMQTLPQSERLPQNSTKAHGEDLGSFSENPIRGKEFEGGQFHGGIL